MKSLQNFVILIKVLLWKYLEELDWGEGAFFEELSFYF